MIDPSTDQSIETPAHAGVIPLRPHILTRTAWTPTPALTAVDDPALSSAVPPAAPAASVAAAPDAADDVIGPGYLLLLSELWGSGRGVRQPPVSGMAFWPPSSSLWSTHIYVDSFEQESSSLCCVSRTHAPCMRAGRRSTQITLFLLHPAPITRVLWATPNLCVRGQGVSACRLRRLTSIHTLPSPMCGLGVVVGLIGRSIRTLGGSIARGGDTPHHGPRIQNSPAPLPTHLALRIPGIRVRSINRSTRC